MEPLAEQEPPNDNGSAITSFLSDVKIEMNAEYLINCRLSPDGRLTINNDIDVTLGNFSSPGENLTEDYREAVLLRIDHCLFQLYRKRLAWPSLLPNEIWIMRSEENPQKKISYNIRALANLYCFVLTCGKLEEYSEERLAGAKLTCFDEDIAKDLITKMANVEDFNITMVLEHPFHWSSHEKIRFICQAFDFINREFWRTREDKKKLELEYGLNLYNVIPNGGWIKELRLKKKELNDAIQRRKELCTHEKIFIRHSVIVEKTDGYDPNSIFDLMRFFRNHHAHYWKDKMNVRLAFGSHRSGYWKFFSKKFPNFFMHVYRTMIPRLPMNDDSMRDGYMARPTYLPTLPIEANQFH